MRTTRTDQLTIAARSAGVGALATLIDLCVLALLVSGLGVPGRIANLPALALGVAVQFVGNKLFAFGDRSGAWLTQGVKFFAVESLGFVLNLTIFDLLVTHTPVPYLGARLISTLVVYYAVCLPLWARIFVPANVAAQQGVP